MHFVAALDRRARGCGPCSPSSRAWPPAPPTATPGWPAARRPPCLHLGPGLGNGMANLHNARRAHSPVVNVVGDHATYHKRLDPPLESDIVGAGRHRLGLVPRAAGGRQTLAADAAEAVAAAYGPPGCVATLVVPADVSWSECRPRPAAAPARSAGRGAVAGDGRRAAAAALRFGRAGRPSCWAARPCGGGAWWRPARVAAATGARLLGETFPANLERGRRPARPRAVGLPGRVRRGASWPARATWCWPDTGPPVSFFAYPGRPGDLVPEGCEVHRLAGPGRRRAGGPRGTWPRRWAPPARRGRDRPGGPPRPARGPAHHRDPGRSGGRPAARGRGGGRRGQHRRALRRRRPRPGPPATTGSPSPAGPSARGCRRPPGPRWRPRPPGAVPGGRRERHVHPPGPVDPGPRGARRDHRGAGQPRLRHLEPRALAGWAPRAAGPGRPGACSTCPDPDLDFVVLATGLGVPASPGHDRRRAGRPSWSGPWPSPGRR